MKRAGSLKTVEIPVKVVKMTGSLCDLGLSNVYLFAIPCLVKLSFIFSGVKNGHRE